MPTRHVGASIQDSESGMVSARLRSRDSTAVGYSAAYAAFAEERFRSGRVTSKPPDLLHDFIFYLRNNHVLLSAFAAHAAHPYPLQRRRLLLLNSIGFAFFVACLAQSLGSTCGTSSECESNRRDREQLRSVLGAPLVAVLRDFPTTLSVLLQLVWDVPGSSMGICHCAKQGTCKQQCGRGMLVCFMCQLVGGVYAALGAILLFVFSQLLHIVEVNDVVLLCLTSKALAFLYAIPVSAVLFVWLWRAEADAASAARLTNGDLV